MWKWAELHPYLFSFLAFSYGWFVIWLISDIAEKLTQRKKKKEEREWIFPKSP